MSTINYEVVDNTIIVFDNVLPEQMCEGILEEVNKNGEFVKSQLPGETEEVLKHRNCEEVYISVTPKLKELDDLIYKVFNQIVSKYLEIVMTNAFGEDCSVPAQNFTLSSDDGYVLIRYKEGGKYAPHIDQITHTNGTKPIRLMSVVMYLNDDFEGGETEFFFQKYKVKPKTGRVVVFPSTITHPHQGCPVTKGTKNVIATWFR